MRKLILLIAAVAALLLAAMTLSACQAALPTLADRSTGRVSEVTPEVATQEFVHPTWGMSFRYPADWSLDIPDFEVLSKPPPDMPPENTFIPNDLYIRTLGHGVTLYPTQEGRNPDTKIEISLDTFLISPGIPLSHWLTIRHAYGMLESPFPDRTGYMQVDVRERPYAHVGDQVASDLVQRDDPHLFMQTIWLAKGELVYHFTVYTDRAETVNALEQVVASVKFDEARLAELRATAPFDGDEGTMIDYVASHARPRPAVPAGAEEGAVAYRFGPTHFIYAQKGPITIHDWLPDSQTLLLSTFPPGEIDDQGSGSFEEIKTLDFASGPPQLFGRRPAISDSHPVWLADVGEVVYFGAEVPVKDPDTGMYYPDLSIVHLRVATPERTQALESPAIGEVRAFTGRNHTVWAVQYDTGAIIEINRLNGEVRKLPVNVRAYGLDPNSYWLQILSHPVLPLLAVFGPDGFLVINSSTGEVKQIDLGEDDTEAYRGKRWTIDAQWSPIREQLALTIGVGEPVFRSTRLFFLDSASGKISQIPMPISWITDMMWAPDGDQLLIRGLPNDGAQEYYLVNPKIGSMVRVEGLPELESAFSGRSTIRWSPDGSKLSWTFDNMLFLIPVTRNE